MPSIRVVPIYSHFEIYINGQFFCSCDTKSEVDYELSMLGYIYVKGSDKNEPVFRAI